MRHSSRSRRRRGFTLIEVLLVLVILVVLASLAALEFSSAQRRSRLDAARSQIGLIKTPLQMYQLDIGSFPTTAQGLDALQTAPSDLSNPNKWGGPYLDKSLPLDPWGNPYQYVSPGTRNPNSYDAWSYGPDGVNGTEDDIGNWD